MGKAIIRLERVAQSIRWIRGQKVLLDSDLAARYGVETKNLNKGVKRNAILEAIRQLMTRPEKPRREIGFHVRERAGRHRAPTRA